MALPSLPTSYQTEAVTLRITLAELSAFVLICFAAEHGRATFLASRPMVYIGRLSYGIYLWHFPVALLLRGTQPLWITLSVTIGCSFTMAAICLHLVDTPLKRWRQKAWPGARSAA